VARLALNVDNIEAEELGSGSNGQIGISQSKLDELDWKFTAKHEEVIQALLEDDQIDAALEAEQAKLEEYEQEVFSLRKRLKVTVYTVSARGARAQINMADLSSQLGDFF